MKSLLLSYKKFTRSHWLRKSMTESSKNACRLLLSVILLTGMVTGVTGPLDSYVQNISGKIQLMRKEIALYREFAEEPDREQKQVRQFKWLQQLKGFLPEAVDAEEEVRRLYRMADRYDITIKVLRRLPDKASRSQISGVKSNRLVWETEFSGTWYNVMYFLNDVETQKPCTRIEALQIRKSMYNRNEAIFSGTGVYPELFVRGRICIYYHTEK